MQVKIIIAIYFLAVVAVGVYSYFKIKTPADYYVSGKKAGLIQVSGSLMATILGGSAILGTIELSQNIGWAALWFLGSAAIGMFLLVPLSKYVSRFGNYTLPELLGSFYGKKAEIISSVIIPVAWIGIVAAQIIAAAKILSGLGFIGYNTAAVVSGVVFIFYTLAGGQKSILKTDAIQSVIIVTGLLLLFAFSINSSDVHPLDSLEIGSLFNSSFSFFDLIILLLTYSVTFIVGPDIYSRLFCAKNEKTASRSILVVAFILIPVSFLLTWLGIFSGNTPDNGIVSFAGHLLPDWAYGLFIAALLSAVMSSADTTLLTSSMILSELTTGSLNHKKALSYTHLFIMTIGVISIIISLFLTSIIQTLLFALTVFSGAFVIPTLAGLLKLNVNKKRVVTAIITGGIVALTGKIIHDFYHDIIGSCIIISTYLISSFLLFAPYKKY
ncbi:MAG TPA: sodium:solute symporter family protein [Draconibacterium sp.]|nr:sodium:solute symporter family protein [Draconibacterium sp.]